MSEKMREDAWRESDDQILANNVLEHIKNGNTQLVAFEITGVMLNRTAAACGFRWNSEVRKRYVHEIQDAKSLRNTKNKSRNEVFMTGINSSIEHNILSKDDFDQILEIIQKQKKFFANMVTQLKKLEQENAELRKKLNETKSSEQIASEDYQNLMRILSRARELNVLENYK